jgi:hypothetical protein
VLDLLRDYGLEDFYLELSTRNPEKSVGTEEDWAEATQALREAAEKQDLELVLDEGGAAFYGPKISVQAKDAIGRTWQMSKGKWWFGGEDVVVTGDATDSLGARPAAQGSLGAFGSTAGQVVDDDGPDSIDDAADFYYVMEWPTPMLGGNVVGDAASADDLLRAGARRDCCRLERLGGILRYWSLRSPAMGIRRQPSQHR